MNRAIVAALLAPIALATAAAAETPVAIVEEVHGKVTGAEPMDYVTPKTVIKLGQNGSIVLSYLNSCRRETITGIGTVIVGTEESRVHLADISGEKINCDASHWHATARETSAVAATIVRSIQTKGDASLAPQVTLYGASPLVDARGRGKLLMERLDMNGERKQVELDGTQPKGRFFDFASKNLALTPGGTYLATFGTSEVVFRIDPQAKSGATPILGRLLRME
jgi:hypothetical protein